MEPDKYEESDRTGSDINSQDFGEQQPLDRDASTEDQAFLEALKTPEVSDQISGENEPSKRTSNMDDENDVI